MFENPRAVFIHIPKCAGTSIRELWNYNARFRTFGYIPKRWKNAPSFAIVRNPEERFLSAIRMFKFGNPEFGGFYADPVWPDLTIDLALSVLADDAIPFERSQRFVPGNFKHHIIAQTHPYNCLSLADTVLRQETLAEDFEKLRQKINLPGPLEHIRQTGHQSKNLVPTTAQRHQIHQAFAEDYKQLGYGIDGKIIGPLAIKPVEHPTLWESWPSFYCSRPIKPQKYHMALPADDVDLTIFANDIVTGEAGKTWPGRSKDAGKHFRMLLPEFVGKSRLAFLLACTIVIIRKTGGSGPGLGLFHRILTEHLEHVCAGLNARWLTSVCDTLADHGENTTQQSLGLCGSLLANMVKLTETERRVFMPHRPWPPKFRLRIEPRLFDGVIGFGTTKGDLILNMLERVNKARNHDQIAGPILVEICARMLENDTVLRRFTRISGNEPYPLLDKTIRKQLETITRQHL